MAPITNVGPNVKRQRFGKDLAMQFPKNKEVKLNLTKEQELKVEGWNCKLPCNLLHSSRAKDSDSLCKGRYAY